MSARKRSERDRRRRDLGQNFLADRRLTDRLVDSFDVRADELVVDLGAGRGALTHALLDGGAEVWAVERDPVWARQLRDGLTARGDDHRGRVIEADLRTIRLPSTRFRVVANPPFGLTTEVLELLLDRPDRGPSRADLLLQRAVALKLARQPARTLRAAAWAPWWEFRLGPTVDRRSFRPVAQVDVAVLTIVRRDPPVLPTWLGPRFRETLRPEWTARKDPPAPGEDYERRRRRPRK